MERNQIFKIFGTDYKKMTKRLLDESDLIGMIGDRKSRIGIKPNLVSPSMASYGATTHPEIVEGIIEYLQERGCTRLTILEGSWVGDRTEEAFELCGYRDLARRYKVELIDTKKDGKIKTDAAGMTLHVCKNAMELDFLINVPVLKGHCQTKVTCALKNMKGLIPDSEKRRFHSMGLHRPIAHLNTVLRPDFIVVDHICGDLDFEDGGNPVVRNCIMTSLDPVLTDAYACYLMHYEIDEVPYIRMAEALGAGSADLEKAEIRMIQNPGFLLDTEHRTWIPDEELPVARKVVELKDAVEEVESCSACYGYLLPALDRLRREGLLDLLTEKICIGQGFRGKSGKLGVGNCTRNFDFSIEGCPPVENDIYEGLKSYITNQH